jgi:hypothetical protein
MLNIMLYRQLNLSAIFKDCMKWSCDGSLANQMSPFLLMYCLQTFAIKCPLYSPWKLGSGSLQAIVNQINKFTIIC